MIIALVVSLYTGTITVDQNDFDRVADCVAQAVDAQDSGTNDLHE